MKPEIECLRCILSVRLREIEQANLSKEEKLHLAKMLISKMLEEFNWDVELTRLASELFNYVVKSAPGVVEYYRSIKRASNRIALENISVHRDYALKLKGFERFHYLVKLSAVANLIDYGVADHKPLQDTLTPDVVEKREVARDDSLDFYNTVVRGGLKLVWLFDNSGEAVYDTLLIEELRKMSNKVYGLVKEEPGFQNDISLVDAEEMGLSNVLDGVISYGCHCSTIHLEHISREVRDLINSSDIVVAKGMSHFEYLSEVELGKPTLFVLVPKCDPVARRIGGDSRGKIVIYFKK